MSSRLMLSFACWDYDRMRALIDGRVRPEGIDLDFIPLTVEETFYRQLRHQDFDVSELSLSSYLLTLNEPDPPFIAIPAFPSRFFRHQSIYINTNSGIESPADLVGKRVGTPEFQMTAGVWQRGILADEYGVPVESVQYFTGALTSSNRREEKVPLDLPSRISITPIPDGANLSDMLAEGELDAIYTAPAPHSYGKVAHVQHLFEDFQKVEKAYFARTQVFPIMHVVAIRRSVYERHPWIARSLMKAFEASLGYAYEDLHQQAALKVMLPWLQAHVAETVAALGSGYWDYGVENNRHVLEAFARYSHEQGLARRIITPEEMFADGADDSFEV
jgi:4,5-dihydroxyphthalate decarboxylase